MKIRGFVLNKLDRSAATGVPIAAIAEFDGDRRQYRMAMLASDNNGYVSFDMAPVLNGRRPHRVVVEAVQEPDTRTTVYKSGPPDSSELIQGMFVLNIVDAPSSEYAISGFSSIQHPDELDWHLSPRSFTVQSTVMLGEDGCEVPIPRMGPLQVRRFFQVVLRSASNSSGSSLSPTGPSNNDTFGRLSPLADQSQSTPQLVEIMEYEQTWRDLGHSLGQIVYSLPLAPCETVKLAMIEATRSDAISRRDAIYAEEHLVHDLRRDRNIDESIETTLNETQGGWSILGGAVVPLSGPLIGAGGAVTRSWGERDLRAESAQELHDHVVQSTGVVRSQTSTVVVQATQTEQHR